MQITTVLLGLAATAAAVDIRKYGNGGCSGRSENCVGANPNTCCGTGGNTLRSIGFAAIPTNWNIGTRAYDGGNCARQIGYIESQGRVDVCHSGAPYSGAGYNIISTKRRDVESTSIKSTSIKSTSIEECKLSNSLTFEDGNELDISALDAAGNKIIGDLFWAGATSAEVEAQIASLQ